MKNHTLNFNACVDTSFLTVLKTWTSSFEHSMIIHAHVRFEFLEVSAARLASRSLNLTVLCLVVDQALVFLLLREEGGLLAFWSIGTYIGRSTIFSGRALFICFMQIFYASCHSWHAQFTSSIHVYGGI